MNRTPAACPIQESHPAVGAAAPGPEDAATGMNHEAKRVDALPKNIGWSIVKNAGGQIGGRIFLSLARFGIAVLIVRACGVERFGEYALLLSLMVIMEWLVDFGTTDIAVRTICQEPERKTSLYNTLAALKFVQTLGGIAVFVGVLLLLDYPAHMLRAGAVAATGLLCTGLLCLFRIHFRVRMLMEREVLAEVLSVCAMIPLTWIACVHGAGLEILIACFVVSRVVYLGAAFAFGGRRWIPKPHLFLGKEARFALVAALPVGISGLLAALYDVLDPVLLSKLANTFEVGCFSGATRFLWPVIIVIHAVANTVFPLLSTYWQRDRDRFRVVLQGTLNMALLAGAWMFCLAFHSADFLMGLLGAELAPAGGVLKVLSLIVITKAVSTVATPLFIVTGHQRHGVWLIGMAVAVKTAVLFWLIPKYGALGAAMGYVVCELCVGVIPTLLLTRYLIGFKVAPGVPARIGAALVVTMIACEAVGLGSTLANGLLAGSLFGVLALAFRVFSASELGYFVSSVRERFT